jgi:hypothetical protein
MLCALRTVLSLRSGSNLTVGSPPSSPSSPDGVARALPSVTVPMAARLTPAAAPTPVHPITNSGLSATAGDLPLEKSKGVWFVAGGIAIIGIAAAAYALRGATSTKSAPEVAGASLVSPPAASEIVPAAPPVPAASSASLGSSTEVTKQATSSPTAGRPPATTSLVHAPIAPTPTTAATQAPSAVRAAPAPSPIGPKNPPPDAGKGRPRFNDIE